MPEAALPEISELLAEWGAGDREAFRALIPLLYDDLHQVAHRHLRKAPATLFKSRYKSKAFVGYNAQ